MKEINIGGRSFKIYVNPKAIQECQRDINTKGMWEPWVTNFLLANLKEDSVFVDAGASVGWFSLLAAAFSPKGRVIAYEPDKDRCSLLCKSKSANGFENLVVSDHALMDKICKVSLGGRAHAQVYSGDTITAEPLDDSLKSLNQYKVDLVKIDVEGAELRVLRGMKNTILRNPQIKIVVELHPKLIKRLFGESIEDLFNFMDGLRFERKRLMGRYWVFSKG